MTCFFFFLRGCHKTCPLSRTRSRLDKIETLLLSQKNSTMFTNNTRRCTCSMQILAKGRNSWFLRMRQNVSWVCFLHLKGKVHLFFLQDDFLLQHFDGVELVVRLVLGEQHLHEGLFVSGLFGKHGVAPLSRHSRRYNPPPQKKGEELATQTTEPWKQMRLWNRRSALIQKEMCHHGAECLLWKCRQQRKFTFQKCFWYDADTWRGIFHSVDWLRQHERSQSSVFW